uniref:Uncharacterized protein n=1 Tax=Spongospora subterranea TaxID=70186 RepID=A0A0H5R4J4_9EUKA|eukprot:CRZ08806.1 hypothetical protein [Spongospora subterranea]
MIDSAMVGTIVMGIIVAASAFCVCFNCIRDRQSRDSIAKDDRDQLLAIAIADGALLLAIANADRAQLLAVAIADRAQLLTVANADRAQHLAVANAGHAQRLAASVADRGQRHADRVQHMLLLLAAMLPTDQRGRVIQFLSRELLPRQLRREDGEPSEAEQDASEEV